MLPIPFELIEKYKDHVECVATNKLLPVKSNAKYNEYIKEVAKAVGITKYLTTHTARHTFATTVTLENDVPIETVSKMLGHSSIRTTQIYAKITQKKMSNNMQVLRVNFTLIFYWQWIQTIEWSQVINPNVSTYSTYPFKE